MRYLIAILALSLTGCVTMLDTMGKPETFAACTTADVLTTAYSVHNGMAYETNPLLGPSVNAGHFFPMLLSKVVLVGAVWWIYEQYKEYEATKYGIAAMSGITCWAAAKNAGIILKAL